MKYQRTILPLLGAAMALSLPLAAQTTVLDVDFSNLTEGVNVTDGDRIEDTSGNGYHGFFGQTNATGEPVVMTPSGSLAIETTTTADDGYVFVRDGLTGIPDAWDGPTTSITPYFTLDGNGSFTLEAVVNWNGTSESLNGIMGQTGGNQVWCRENGGNFDYAIGVGDAVNRFGLVDISAAKADGQYHGLALIYDSTAGEVRLYLDGILIDTNDDTDGGLEISDIGTLGTLLSGTGDFRLGSYNGNESANFNGIQDRFRITMGALDPVDFLTVPFLPPGDDITWTGSTDGIWDTTTTNWELDSNSSVVTFSDLDSLTFDDNGANTAITINAGGGSVAPGDMLFNNSISAYSLAGDGTSGSGLLTKQGTATLTLTNPNEYGQGTDLQGGDIIAGDGAVDGEIGGGPVSTVAGTTLTISRSDTLDYAGGNTPGGGSKLRELSGDGELIIDGGVNLILNPGNGNDLDFDLINGWATFTGPVSIKGNSTLDTRRMGRTALGSGTVTLGDGGSSGSLASHVGNWTYTNDINLVGSANEILNNNTTATNRYLKLQGILSGAGGLTFADPNGTMLDPDRGFVLTGANTLSGAITIDFDAPVRVGGVPGDDTSLAADAFGNLGTATVANDGFLSFTRTDAHQVDNAITGLGTVRIGRAVGGTETQVVTIGTSQAYTGDTVVLNGVLNVPTGVTLDSFLVDVQAGGTLAGNGTLAGDIDLTGNVAPGASVGTLTSSGTVSLLGNSTYTWEINNWIGTTPGTDYDLLTADTIDILATNLDPVTIFVTPDSLVGFAESNQTYTIATATSFLTGFAADAFVVDDTALVSATGTWAVQLSGDTLSLELIYTLGTGDPYDIWAAGFGLENPWLGVDPALNGEPTADADGDGVSNEKEYAFGLDPTDSTSVSPITQGLDKGTGLFTYTRLDPVTTGLTYTVQTSPDLTSPWADDLTAVQNVTGTVDGVQTVEVTLTGAPLGATTLFAQVVAD